MVQFHMPKGNTFQAGAMGTNNHNSLSKQELRRKWQLGGTEKCYPVLNHARILPNLTGGGKSQEKNGKLWDFF
jgi:hypothetical protein